MTHLPHPAAAAALLAVAGSLACAGTARAHAEGVPITRPAPRAASRPALARPPAEPLRSRITAHYVRSAAWAVLFRRGCRAGRRNESGVVVLAFGKPSYDGHAYGTLTFSGRFASNHRITEAMMAFARGYAACLPRGSRSHIVLARGTSNYHLSVPSAYQAGRRWARETVGLARSLRAAGLTGRVRSAAAIDAEPAWNPGFRKTSELFRGYGAYRPGYPLYDFGSLDGGVGKVWSARQVWYVAAGMRYARALPQIYYSEMARQWATMSRIAVQRFGRPIRFAGIMMVTNIRWGD